MHSLQLAVSVLPWGAGTVMQVRRLGEFLDFQLPTLLIHGGEYKLPPHRSANTGEVTRELPPALGGPGTALKGDTSAPWRESIRKRGATDDTREVERGHGARTLKS